MLKISYLNIILISVSLGLKKRHTLIILLTLELWVLIIILLLMMSGLEIFFGILIICVGACEGVIGLRSLIRRTRVVRTVSI